MQPKKQVLIIVYYWPPAGGSGVQRWIYFTKYLRELNWEPVIYTVQNPEAPYQDESLSGEIPSDVQIIKEDIWEPFGAYRKIAGIKEGQKIKSGVIAQEKKSIKRYIIKWIRANLFIPDPRVNWITKGTRTLTKFLSTNKIDLIITSGPPHSAHLIGRKLHKKTNIPWIVDFRDPWTQVFNWNLLPRTSLVEKIHKTLELNVLKECDGLITVSHHCMSDLLKICSVKNHEIITNGFDHLHTSSIPANTKDQLEMLYTGVLSADRNPVQLWKSLATYLDAHPNFEVKFKLVFYGDIDTAIGDSIQNAGLGKYTTFHPPVKHEKIIQLMQSADLLLLIGVPNEPGVVTGKIFEYISTGKPILAVSPVQSDIEHILQETKTGINIPFEDVSNFDNIMSDLISFLNTPIDPPSLNQKILKYHRKNLTGQLVNFLNKIISTRV